MATGKTRVAMDSLLAFPQENPNPVVELDLEGHITYANPGAVNLLERLELPKDCPEALLPPNTQLLIRACLDGDGGVRFMHEIDGTVLGWSLHPIRRLGVIHGYGADITERHHADLEIIRLNEELEERVRERTIELCRANEDLEAFAEALTHDLRSPAFQISGLADMLLRKASKCLDETEMEIARTIKAVAARMEDLIDDMMVLANAAHNVPVRNRFHMGKLVSEVIDDLKNRLPKGRRKGRQIEWKVAPMNDVYGEPALLKQVLINLLDNAVKYTRPSPRVVIEITQYERLNDDVICVKDNGAGFPPEIARRLFAPFQRFHTGREFEGHGLGLAIVERIIQRHGGEVWAESGDGDGATFCFSLPRAETSDI